MKNITRAITLTTKDIIGRMGMRSLIAFTNLVSHVPGCAKTMVDVLDRHDNGLFDRCQSILESGQRSDVLHRAYRRGGKREVIMAYRSAFRYLEMYNTIAMIAFVDEYERRFQKEES